MTENRRALTRSIASSPRKSIIATLCFISLSLSLVSAHYADPRVASFTIPVKTGLTKQTVQVAAGKAKAVCEFQYSTTEVVETPKEAAPKEPEAPVAGGNVRAVLDGLKETCVSKRVDYWEYEVCLGGNVRQFHNPDSYALGTFSRWEGDDQIYDKGQVCSARPDNANRAVKVTFGCLKGGSEVPKAALVSITETQICMYTVVIGTPLACAFSQFPVVTDIPSPVSQPPPPMSFDDGSEDWFLQLSELADGRFICSALSNEARATGSKLAFTKIELALRVENLPLPSSIPAESAHQYLARKPGRGLLPAKEFQPSFKTEQDVRETVIKSSNDFQGKLAFVKVFA